MLIRRGFFGLNSFVFLVSSLKLWEHKAVSCALLAPSSKTFEVRTPKLSALSFKLSAKKQPIIEPRPNQ